MKLTLMIKLAPSAEQRAALLATMEAFNAAATDLAAWATEHDTTSKWAIQAARYKSIRETYGLSAQLTVRAITCAAYACKTAKKGTAPVFKPHSAVVYDSRIMSFKGLEYVSLSTLYGRQLIPMRVGNYQRARMDRQRGEADLVLKNGVFYLAVTLDAPEPELFDPEGTLGVDLGIVNLAVDSDGAAHTGERVDTIRVKYTKRAGILQTVGTRSARRRLMKQRGREARFRRDMNHVISKQLVGKAQGTARQIALEELTGIRQRTTVRRSQRSRQGGWAFAQLRAFIEYKARLAGVPVVLVDARNTSRTCSVCGHCEKANRRSQAEFWCKKCGHAAPADLNAAGNIAARGEVMRPTVPAVACAA